MAKGMNIRGNKELKKPKQPKKVTVAVVSSGGDRSFDPASGLGAKKKP